jgi:hypothetical protein
VFPSALQSEQCREPQDASKTWFCSMRTDPEGFSIIVNPHFDMLAAI